MRPWRCTSRTDHTTSKCGKIGMIIYLLGNRSSFQSYRACRNTCHGLGSMASRIYCRQRRGSGLSMRPRQSPGPSSAPKQSPGLAIAPTQSPDPAVQPTIPTAQPFQMMPVDHRCIGQHRKRGRRGALLFTNPHHRMGFKQLHHW
ncbi:hypothetical protein Gotur_005039 [Gossypium turneri]